MSKTVLLTIGRLPKVLDLARSFAARGDRVIIADPFRWHLMRVSNVVSKTYAVTAPASDRDAYFRDLLKIVEIENVDLVVPVSEETMYVTALRDRLPSRVAMFSMPQADVVRLHNKRDFISTAASFGLNVPETHDFGTAEASRLAQSADFVVKPVFSCSGRGVTMHRAGEPLSAHAGEEPAIVQRKINGPLYSTFSIARDAAPRITIVYRAAVMSGTVAVCFERVADQTAIEDWVTTFVRRAGYTGFISFDMIVDAHGQAFAIECNPRVTSGVHFVCPDDLAHAITAEPRDEPVKLRENNLMQQLYPCLTETQKSLLRPADFRRNLGCLLAARDVTWSLRDPLPFLLMPFTAAQIIARAISQRQSFGEASTYDISWHPPHAASPGSGSVATGLS